MTFDVYFILRSVVEPKTLNSGDAITRNLLEGIVGMVDFTLPWNKEGEFSFFSLRKGKRDDCREV